MADEIDQRISTFLSDEIISDITNKYFEKEALLAECKELRD